MEKKMFGIIVCMLLFTAVLPVSGTIILEKNTMPTIYNGSLLGYVNDTSMDPIEGALVRVYFHENYREDHTDSTGYYHVTNIPICYCLKNCTASKEGYNSEWVWMGITENTTYDFVLNGNGGIVKNNQQSNNICFLLRGLERFPNAFPILRILLRL